MEQLTENVVLYCGDCRDVVPSLSGVDVVITDPPYSEVTHKGNRSNFDDKSRSSGERVDFGSVDADFIRGVFGVCKPRRWLVSFLDWHHVLPLEMSPPAGLEFVRMGIWTKLNPMPQLTGDRPGTGWESLAIFHPPGKKSWNGGSGPAVWNFGTTRFGFFGQSHHPTEKQLDLVRKLVRDFSDPGETILDPFAGSGTTAVAAIAEGRTCVLIEKDAGYCDVIRRRVENANGVGGGSLFRQLAF